MKDSTRAKVAAAVGAAYKKKSVSSVYDYSTGSHKSISAKVENGTLSGFDYGSSSHFSGGSNDKLDFYDYETSSHVQLKLEGSKFSGYDYHSSNHFSGNINGSFVSIYDYETGQHYNFSV
ncbi:hypothetical protein [Desulfoplanes formicivorans]|uniref:Uncharacterized protein n=1 Tax=Desulfoplanes formicivorans TaxID=1592317 RepID=A0A194AJG2_9BACT|nr:hypothetical protein [Desulfoplanes formicivorans]GAU08884.1 hypothetical protein DPF_1601 [Desulfoplanes formicivorans]